MLRRVSFVLVMMLTLWAANLTAAQGGLLQYGNTVFEALDANTPQKLYTFNGNAGDMVNAYVLSAEFAPTLTLLSPIGQLGFSNQDTLTPISGDARVSVRLPQAGSYSLILASATGTFGNYVLTLQGSPQSINAQLSSPQEITLAPESALQTFDISRSTESASTLTLEAVPATLPFAAQLSDERGAVVAAVSGALPSVSFTLPAGTSPYTLTVSVLDVAQTGVVRISQGGTSAPSAQAPLPPTGNETALNIPANVCAVLGNGVNLRSGPGTEYNIVANLAPNSYMTATGQYNGWYTGTYQGVSVWAAQSVTTTQGASCAGLPQVQPPAAPNTGQVGQPTVAASTPTTAAPTDAAPTQPPPTQAQPTPTPTTAAQIAPLDADVLNFTLNRDAGGQFSDTISSPDGDTSDRVRITINDLFNQPPNNTRSFRLTLVCNGEGSQNVRWGTGGPSNPTNLTCGGSVDAFHTNDSNLTFVNINMSGTGFVTYTLIATIL